MAQGSAARRTHSARLPAGDGGLGCLADHRPARVADAGGGACADRTALADRTLVQTVEERCGTRPLAQCATRATAVRGVREAAGEPDRALVAAAHWLGCTAA